MKKCIECGNKTEGVRSIRCIKCKAVLRKKTAKKNREKHQYNKQPKYRYATYKRGAEKRGYSFELSIAQFCNLWGRECFYCGEKNDGIGIDRKDNSIGYTEHNSVSCCKTCNFMKGKLTAKEFIQKCRAISRVFTMDKVD